MMKNAHSRALIVLVVGVLAMSSASILIRLAQAEAVPSIVIAAYRLTIATVVLTVPLVRQQAWREYARLETGTVGLLVGSGLLLGLHFASWITSLEFTSVANSVVLVTTTPLWIALASPILLGEKTPTITWAGIAVAIVGGAVVAATNPGGEAGLRGDALALGGAIFAAGYLMIGRGTRESLSLVAYLWVVYGSAAVLLLVWAGVAGLPVVGFSGLALLSLVGLGLIPQLIGHSAANYAMRHLSATVVSISILGEPIGAIILAILILGELPTGVQLLGSGLILTGIVMATVVEAGRKRRLRANET